MDKKIIEVLEFIQERKEFYNELQNDGYDVSLEDVLLVLDDVAERLKEDNK